MRTACIKKAGIYWPTGIKRKGIMMKFKTLKEKVYGMNLQFFAGDNNGDGDNGAGEDQEESDDTEDEQEEVDNEPKFTQADVDKAIEKRIARERRKWQRQQQTQTPKNNGNGEPDEKNKQPDKNTQELEKRAAKADELEIKLTAFELGADKSSIGDVIALAKARVEADNDLDIEDAIEEVLKKYPSFKASSNKDDGDESEKETNKSWGERQKGKTKKLSGVEERFYELNPDLNK